MNYNETDCSSPRKHKDKFVIVEPANGPIDLSLIPTSPMEYLQCVQQEREQCPSLLRAVIDPRKSCPNQTAKISKPENEKRDPPPGFASSASWKHDKIMKFTNMRKKLFIRKDELRMRFKNYEKLLPKSNYSMDWCLFCLGPKCVEVLNNHESNKTSFEEFNESDGNAPFLRFVIHLSTSQIIKLIEYHIQWLDRLGFSHHQGRWIFALLACLEEPLFPDSVFVLRKVVGVCSAIRQQLKDNQDSLLAALNHIICIITIYFRQKDMADADGPE